MAIDRSRIAQVIGNLLDNAIQHTGEGGTVTVRTVGQGPDGVFSAWKTKARAYLPRRCP